MITMKPIGEPDVVALLAKGRFDGALEGYVMTDGAEYLGYCLFRLAENVTEVLDAEAPDNMMLDGLVRAAVAKGENEGADSFRVSREVPALCKWAEAFLPGEQGPVKNTKIFGNCG
ncbi:hypothetical protein H8S23_11690 [Anaerofilum sp. BX8]|uniref:Uncharacterized protein n=1 Tax=Anaerofilum hominis TaxID=2763016 RepID=A0A923L1F0_9FIRM|nr:hypothetical protein [Anaerofilum hominis]MBC5582170.1 hypothetical protein [Anaerofilum hominis]